MCSFVNHLKSFTKTNRVNLWQVLEACSSCESQSKAFCKSFFPPPKSKLSKERLVEIFLSSHKTPRSLCIHFASAVSSLLMLLYKTLILFWQESASNFKKVNSSISYAWRQKQKSLNSLSKNYFLLRQLLLLSVSSRNSGTGIVIHLK